MDKKDTLGYYLFMVLIIPIFISGLYILVIGSICIITTNDYIESCVLFKDGEKWNYYIVYVNTVLNNVSGILCLLLMKNFGLNSFTHRSLLIKEDYRVDFCGKKNFDCRLISIYLFYWFLCLILQIECYWDVGKVEKMWNYSINFSVSIFITTWTSMTIFPKNLRKGLNEIDEFFVKKKYYCCSFNYPLEYSWIPFFLFSSFFYNFVWFFYDMIRLSIRSSHSTDMIFYHLNIILSAIAISFRGFYAYSYWIKFLNNQPVTPFYSAEIMMSEKKLNEF